MDSCTLVNVKTEEWGGGGDRHVCMCVGGAFKSDNEEPLFKFPNLGVLQEL